MVTNEQIRRARPTVDSPLARLIRGKISRDEYLRQVEQKRDRESPVSRRVAATQQ